MANLKVKLGSLASAQIWTQPLGLFMFPDVFICLSKEEGEEEDNVEQRSPEHCLFLF